MIKIERQEPVTKQTNESDKHEKTHSNKATTNLWLCAWQRKNKNAKSRNKQTIDEKKNHSHTHKSEYGNSMGICQRSLSKTHIKWSNLYPWKLAREHHYQQHIDIHQHDDDRLVQVSALNCPINALIQKKYPAHKN